METAMSLRLFSFSTFLLLITASFSQLDADVTEAEVDRSIQRGVGYLRTVIKTNEFGQCRYLIAYTLLKTGTPPNDPFIVETVNELKEKLAASQVSLPDHYYNAGIAGLLFDTLGGEQYQPQLAALAKYIMAGQRANGGWYYPDLLPGQSVGDTSITQYALLGLWTAERNGVEIPKTVWSRAATWLVNCQTSSGAYAYHPDENVNDGKTGRPSLQAAGTSSLFLCKRQLYPHGFEAELKRRKEEESADANVKLYGGILELVDVTESDSAPAGEAKKDQVGEQLISPSRLQSGIDSAMRYMNSLPEMGLKDPMWRLYYLYGLERVGAFAELDKIGNKDWYQTGAEALLKIQLKDGGWPGQQDQRAGTCFAVLFLERATAKAIKPPPARGPRVGGGLLAGGRNLPSDLTKVQQKDGKIIAETNDLPVTDLLSQLEASATADLKPIQEEIIEKVRSEQRDELIGQVERLEKLLRSPDAQVRAIAAWSLARSNDLSKVPLLIDLIRKDPDYDVAREANRGLCVLSRRLKGVGYNDDPITDADRESNPKQAEQRAIQWRASAAKAWQDWYLKVRAYHERDDLLDLKKQ